MKYEVFGEEVDNEEEELKKYKNGGQPKSHRQYGKIRKPVGN